jgi:hypothetical protein
LAVFSLDAYMISIEPDDYVERVEPRHPATNKRLLDKLIREMQTHAWQGRPLLVVKKGNGYETITGCHRAAAAMKVGFPIPVVVLDDADLTKAQWEKVDGAVDYGCLDSVFDEAGLHKAAELMRQEKQYGGTMSPVHPTKRPLTEGRRFSVKRNPPEKE